MLTEVYKSKRGPKAIIEHFYEKVGITEAFIVVLVSFVINMLLCLVLKVPGLGRISAYNAYSSILINWLLLGIIIYLLLYFIKGAKNLPKKSFQKVLSSLSAFRIPAIIYTIISVAIALLFLSPYIPVFQAILQNNLLANSMTLYPALTTANIIGIILLATLSLVFLVYVIVMLYQFSKTIFDVKSPALTIVLMLLVLAITALLRFIFL